MQLTALRPGSHGCLAYYKVFSRACLGRTRVAEATKRTGPAGERPDEGIPTGRDGVAQFRSLRQRCKHFVCKMCKFVQLQLERRADMSTSRVQVSKAELDQMITQAVERKLLELLGDPDERLVLKKSLRSRLLRQKKTVARGERGEEFDKVVNRLGLHG